MIYSLNNSYISYSSVIVITLYIVVNELLLRMLSTFHSRSAELKTNAHFRLVVLDLKEIYVLLLPN